MKIKSIERVEPVLSRCIEVDSPERLYRVENGDGPGIVTHNSVSQRNIVFSTIMRPDNWYFLGIDLKRVELSAYRPYSNVVMKIATDLQAATDSLRFAQQSMMKRYTLMEELGVDNFLKLPKKGRALMVMVDEAGELLDDAGQGKALSGSTEVVMSDGSLKPLIDVEVGDTVLDPNMESAVVTDKYEPLRQSHHFVHVRQVSTGRVISIHSGGEHLWTVRVRDPKGRSLSYVVKTSDIREALANGPDARLELVRAHTSLDGGKAREEVFVIERVEDIESNERLFCISVSSPTRQFLVTRYMVPTHNTDEAKEMNALKSECNIIIGSIARLGRAAGVHLVIATQRADAKLIAGETKTNLGARIACGTLDSMASSIALGNAEGTRIRGNPKGRMFVQVYGKGNHGQGFFAEQSWIDEWLKSQGLNQDGTPLNSNSEDAGDSIIDTISGDETLEADAFEGSGGEKHDHLSDWDDELSSYIQENNS